MRGRTVKRFLNLILVLLIFTTLLPFKVYAAETFGMLLNGSFEDGINFAGSYYQPNQSQVPNWSTTATDKKIELYKANSNFYITGVSMAPTDGIIGAELNAEEESTLYQVVQTEPFSLYEWGLDHAARTSANTMALIIGPNQVNAPSKNYGEGYDKGDLSMENPPLKTGYKYGRDQLMQMVDWLKAIGKIGDVINTPGIANNGQAIIIYSKKFGENGSFLDDADSRPFSLTPSSVYSERWYIWIMTDNCATSGENPWGHYGLNDDENTDKYYLYKVPEGQTSTLFSFVSVETTPKAGTSFPDPTYGNFLDNINFKIYRKLSASSSTHGSGIVGTSNGNVGGEQSLAEYEVTVDNELVTYVSDGDTLNVQAKIGAAEKNTASFAGFFYTYLDNEGNSQTEFLKKDSVTEVVESDGSLTYSYALNNITSAVNIHFVFIKSPLITYDSNGGKPYKVTETGSNVAGEDDNVYNFIPDYDGELKNFVVPYFSHAAEGLNDGWKFINWSVYSEGGYVADIPAEHEISCNYEYDAAAGATGSTQNFKIYENVNTFTSNETSKNVTWIPEGEGYVLLKDINAKGLTMVANWEWKHMFIPVTEDGGTVSLISTGETEDTGNGSFAYYSSGNETIRVKATPNENYVFLGWYDENDNLITLDEEFEYTSVAEETPVYYAKFEKRLIQKYKRKLDGAILPDDDASLIPVLDHSYIECADGEYVSSTASNNETYALEGWYDEDGNKVDASLLSNNRKTISYIATENKTYIAKYVRAVSVNFKRQYLRPDGTYFETATNGYGTLSIYSASGAPGGTISSKAYPGTGYYLYGWYDADNNKLSEDAIFSPVLPDANEVTYYARFASRSDTKYTVNHIFRNFNGTTNKTVSERFVGVTGTEVTPIQKTNLTGDYKGYVYVSGIETKTINGNGTTVFNLYYSKEENELIYNKNNENATGEMANTSGYTGLSVPVNQNGFALAGYKFNGWNTAPDGTGTSYAPGHSYLLIELDKEGNNPNVLYAMWVPQGTLSYKVQHYKTDKNGVAVGNPEEDEYFALEGAKVNAIAKNYDGYTINLDHTSTVSSGIIPSSGKGELVLKLYYKPAEDTLTYKPNGGVENDVVENGYIDEKLTVKGAIFTRPGYTFTGWKDANGVSYSENSKYTLSTQTDILYAQWSANTNTPYTVEHYLLNADASNANLHQRENKTGTTGKTVSASALAITGYTVKTNLNSGAFVSKQTGVITGDGSLVLKLYYVPNDIILTYKANGGVGSDKTFVQKYGTTTSIIDNPFTKEGYHFTGWSEYSVGQSYTFKEDKTLYATWAPDDDTKYTIEYYLLNSDETSSTLYNTVEKTGTTDTTVNANPILIEGYSFFSSYPENIVSTTVNGDGSTVLRLYYAPNADKLIYKKFDTEDSKSFIQDGHTNESLNVLDNMFTYEDHTFIGWMVPGGTDYNDSTYTLTPYDDILIAKWRNDATTKYIVEHIKEDLNGFVLLEEETLYGVAGKPITATPKNFPGATYMPDYELELKSAAINADGSTVLRLYYSTDMVKLIYHSNYGEDSQIERTAAYGTNKTIEDNMFTRPGYEFKGWSTTPDGNGDNVAVNSSLTLTEEKHLYAMWEAKTITITYNANGGTGADVTQSGIAGETKTTIENPFTMLQSVFVGWNTKADGSGTMYDENADFIMPDEDTTLYAIWRLAPLRSSYTVIHYLLKSDNTVNKIYSEEVKGGNVEENVSETFKEIPHYTSKPEMSTTSGKVDLEGLLKLELYYFPDAAKIIYHDGEEYINELNVYYDEDHTIITSPVVRDNKVFKGWKDEDGVIYNVNDIYTVNKDILNLFAIWEDTSIPPVVDKLTYKANINFDTDADVEQSGNQNDSITVKGQLFTRNGYEFKGWNTKHDGTGTWYYENNAYTLSDEEDILFAIWEEIPVYEYKIYHKTSSGIILKEETKQAQKGETVSANSLDFNGYTYADGYDGSIKQGTVLDENLELILFYTPNSNTQYKVEHYLMNVEGTYDLDPDEVENLNGTTGTNVGATKNTYDGYIFDETGENILQGEIQANGSLVLKVYYRRLSSKIVFDSNTGESKEFTGLIGQNIKVINNPFVKDGYEFIEWNTKADGNGEKIEIGQSVSYEKETKTYYAIWKKKTEETPEEEKPVIPERKPVINTGVGMKEVLLSWIYGIMRFFRKSLMK